MPVKVKKICFITASPLTLRCFMRNHILCLANEYEVTAVANFSPNDLKDNWLPGVRIVRIPIVRNISIFFDIVALLQLIKFFHKERFDAVHSVTPKAGLLAMTAARFTYIPIRIHNLSGQVWATQRGLFRMLLKSIDHITIKNSTRLLSDSFSQIEFLRDEGLVREERVDVLGSGSICGVDHNRFHPSEEQRQRVRSTLGISDIGLIILFVGRLKRDKGILDLAKAFAQLAGQRDDLWLVVVGDYEEDIGDDFERYCGSALTRVRRVGHTDSPEHYMAAADVFALPSYRESFGVTVIEAAACGLPSVTSRVCGLIDAVVEDKTGLMHPPGDVPAIRDHLLRLCSDSVLRARLGTAAMVRAKNEYLSQRVSKEFVSYYKRTVKRSDPEPPVRTPLENSQ